ncbi:hypothetical protein [Spirosoma gilvum]
MDTPFLTPIEKPKSLLWKLLYFFTRKRFGKVITPLKVMAVRLPVAFGSFSGKIAASSSTSSLACAALIKLR